MKKIKIITKNSHRSLLNKPGGGEKSVLVLAIELKKKGYQPSILCFGKENYKGEITFKGIRIPVREYYVNPIAFFAITLFIPSMYNKLKKEEKDADIFHFYNVQLDPLAGFYKILNKDKKIISTLNSYHYISPNFECNINGKLVYKYNFLQKFLGFFDLLKQNYPLWLALILIIFFGVHITILYNINIFLSKQIGHYTALSQTIKEIYEINGFKNIKIIPNMYDELFSIGRKLKKEKIVLFVGRIKKLKGVENLIIAFNNSTLPSKGYKLRIVGDGYLKKDLEEKYACKHINFVGPIPYRKVQKEYEQAEIFVHPGIWPEPFGRTILEAIQNSCKIIVSNIGEPPNIVKGQGLIYSYNVIEELVNKLNYSINHKNAGLVDKKILSHYSPENIIYKYEKIYSREERIK